MAMLQLAQWCLPSHISSYIKGWGDDGAGGTLLLDLHSTVIIANFVVKLRKMLFRVD